MNIYEKLSAVQQELKAPKDKKNTYAGYNYRSAEGILEAVKPLLAKYKCAIMLSDDIEVYEDRIYVKSCVYFIDVETENGAQLRAVSYAREAQEKKGLDVSQVTGTASSYARKYALNGLLLIDDTKDPDTDEYQKQTKDEPEEMATEAQKKTIGIMANKAGLKLEQILKKPINELTAEEGTRLIIALKKKLGE